MWCPLVATEGGEAESVSQLQVAEMERGEGMKIKLADLEVDPTVNIRDKLDEETVQWYMEIFDQLPPVTAFRLNGRVLLADGFHRWSAAERLNLKEIEADVRDGTEQEAWEFAVMANWRHGKNLSQYEHDKAIGRLHMIYGTQKAVADLLSIAESTVRRALKAIELAKIPPPAAGRQTYNQARLSTIAGAPTEEQQKRLMERTDLSPPELQASVRTLKDPEVSEDYKERMLKGAAPPILTGGRVLTGSVEKMVVQAKKYDSIGAIWTVLNAIARVRELGLKSIRQQASMTDADAILRLLRDDIAFLERVKSELEKA